MPFDTRGRRARRLEQAATAHKRSHAAGLYDALRPAAELHARRLIATAFLGEPLRDEPLAEGAKRAWEHLSLKPDAGDDAFRSAFDAQILPLLPGATVVDRLAAGLSRVPGWLRSFGAAPLSEAVLGISGPRSSEADAGRGLGGAKEALHAWPDLPRGTTDAGQPIAELLERVAQTATSIALSEADALLLADSSRVPDQELSPGVLARRDRIARQIAAQTLRNAIGG